MKRDNTDKKRPTHVCALCVVCSRTKSDHVPITKASQAARPSSTEPTPYSAPLHLHAFLLHAPRPTRPRIARYRVECKTAPRPINAPPHYRCCCWWCPPRRPGRCCRRWCPRRPRHARARPHRRCRRWCRWCRWCRWRRCRGSPRCGCCKGCLRATTPTTARRRW